jgi:hypothetical protein
MMSPPLKDAHADWQDRNRLCLLAALNQVRRYLERDDPEPEIARPALDLRPAEPPTALATLCHGFELSPFERDILLIAAGMELDSHIHDLVAAHGGANFALALSALPGAHWSAVGPNGPLRRWRLIEFGVGGSLVQTPFRIDEYVLEYLLGMTPVDARLLELSQGFAEIPLTRSQVQLADQITTIWREAKQAPPIIQLVAREVNAPCAEVAQAVCADLGMGLLSISAAALPTVASELDLMSRLCARHARLTHGAIVLSCEVAEGGEAAREAALDLWIERLDAPLFLTARKRRQTRRRPSLSFDVMKPTCAEQTALWRSELGPEQGMADTARQLAAQFHLGAGAISIIAAEARARISTCEKQPHHSSSHGSKVVWEAARQQLQPQLDNLAQRVSLHAGWPDLVLPEPQMQILRSIAVQLAHRPTVLEAWGFGSAGERGLGLVTLFAGSSGTGKTLAAEILAQELNLDLYRVDLGAVVSKYIGETEKNLSRVFDAAEEGGAILLFDEADALFGKRTEVSDSHDRHANVEVSYLLQRVETFRGLAILTTNMRGALDAAFLRRLRFVVNFPFPDAAMRARMWDLAFPPGAPTEGLDVTRLSQLNLSGGQIRTVALNAAFLAAARGGPVGMEDIQTAARMEYAKHDKILTDSELKGWRHEAAI